MTGRQPRSQPPGRRIRTARVIPWLARLAQPGPRGRRTDRKETTVQCTRCHADVPEAAHYCQVCGLDTHNDDRARRTSFAAKPNESVVSLRLVSTIMPRGSAVRPMTYQFALGIALLATVLAAATGALFGLRSTPARSSGTPRATASISRCPKSCGRKKRFVALKYPQSSRTPTWLVGVRSVFAVSNSTLGKAKYCLRCS